MKNFSRVLSLMFISTIFSSLIGCSLVMQPFEEPVFVEANTSDTVFVVPMQETSQQESFNSVNFLEKSMVATKRIRVNREWVQTSRKWFFGIGPYVGYYQPTVKVIKVDRSPVNVKWHGDTNGIWVESKDSVGFSTGVEITARILTEQDAAMFLYNYPGVNVNEQLQGESVVAHVAVANLSDVLNREVRVMVQKIFAREAAKNNMDELRGMKNEVITAIETEIVPYFKERGIDITTVGQFDGYTYQDGNIQTAINKVFQAQQDKQVAIAEAEAAQERKLALQLLGEGEAGKTLAIAQGRAEGVKVEADAEAYKVTQLEKSQQFYLQSRDLDIREKWLEIWDGKLPHYLMGNSDNTNMLLQLPSVK